MKIRKAVVSDLDKLKALLFEQYVYHRGLQENIHTSVSADVLVDDDWLEDIINSTASHIIICAHENELAGLVLFSEEHTDKASQRYKKWLYIKELIVNERFRSKGIGSKLMEHVENYAKEKSIECIKLNVLNNNDTAIGFYAKNDFKVKKLGMWKILQT